MPSSVACPPPFSVRSRKTRDTEGEIERLLSCPAVAGGVGESGLVSRSPIFPLRNPLLSPLTTVPGPLPSPSLSLSSPSTPKTSEWRADTKGAAHACVVDHARRGLFLSDRSRSPWSVNMPVYGRVSRGGRGVIARASPPIFVSSVTHSCSRSPKQPKHLHSTPKIQQPGPSKPPVRGSGSGESRTAIRCNSVDRWRFSRIHIHRLAYDRGSVTSEFELSR